MISGVHCMIGWLDSIRNACGRRVRSQQSYWFRGEIKITPAVTTTRQLMRWNWRIVLEEYHKTKLVEQRAFRDLACCAAETPRQHSTLTPISTPEEIALSNQIMVLLWAANHMKWLTHVGKIETGLRLTYFDAEGVTFSYLPVDFTLDLISVTGMNVDLACGVIFVVCIFYTGIVSTSKKNTRGKVCGLRSLLPGRH